MDTDVLIALVLSAVGNEDLTQESILYALVESDGDVERAVSSLRNIARKRKRESDLSTWLTSASSGTSTKLSPAPAPSSLRSTSPLRPTRSTVSSHEESSKYNSRPLARLPPLTLGTPDLIKLHTPTTLHPSILPQELACQLFYSMVDDAQTWPRNTWYLFDKLVTSPHRTTFFVRSQETSALDTKGMASFWYNGKSVPEPKDFPPLLEQACQIVDRVVLSEMGKRPGFPLEWGGTPAWVATVAAVNCYEGMKEGVGYHADALTYLGPQCTIASLSLGCERRFRLRETVSPDINRAPRTFDIPLPHNSLLIMHPLTQERFKHSVPPQATLDVFRPVVPRHPGAEVPGYNQRINITFRFYRPDFGNSIPRCKCGIPAILRSDLKGVYSGKAGTEEELRYFWQCDASKADKGKGCGLWQFMDWRSEERGPMKTQCPDGIHKAPPTYGSTS